MSSAASANPPATQRGQTRGGILKLLVQYRDAAALGILLTTYALLQYFPLNNRSATYDEPIHLTAGYFAAAHHDFRIDATHPPFLRMWSAIPLLWMKDVQGDVNQIHNWPEDKFVSYAYRYATSFVHNPNRGEQLLHSGRVMMTVLGGLLGLLLYCWAREWLGYCPAVFVLALYCIEPNLSAHASLITTDVGSTCFYLGSVYFLWRAVRNYTWYNIGGVSLFFALAIVSKFSAVLLVPTFILISAVAIWWLKTIKLRRVIFAAAVVCTITYLFVWAVYWFRYAPTETTDFHWSPDKSASAAAQTDLTGIICNWIDNHQLLPNAFIQGFAIGIRQAQNLPSYFAGEISRQGWWYYFPVAFILKTPPAMILLSLSAVGFGILRRKNLGGFNLLTVSLPIAVYFSVAITSHINIGVRHILPVFPFLLLIVGVVAYEVMTTRRSVIAKRVWVATLFLGWSTDFGYTYPNTLTYFSIAAGGTNEGKYYLTDSNIDWGQDLKILKVWMDRNSVKKINLAYFGAADPAFYGIDRISLPGNASVAAKRESKPELPGYVAISETLYSGVYWVPEARILYAGFRNLEPVEVIGNTIRIYHIESWPTVDYNQLSEVNSATPQQVIALGDYLMNINWPDQALRYFQLAADLKPAAAEIQAKIGTIHLKKGRTEEAIVSYQRAVELSPESAKYRGLLCGLLITRGRMDEAKIHAVKWVQLEPKDPDAHHCLGVLYLDNNHPRRARSELTKALSLDPKSEEVRELLDVVDNLIGTR